MDDRKYTTPRLSMAASWKESSTFNTFMKTKVPTPFSYCGIDVVNSGNRYEIWSPNTTRLASYPSLHLLPNAKLFDGSYGRNDYGLFPQVLTDETLHWAFIKRCRPEYPEWFTLTSHWVPSHRNNLNHGSPSEEFKSKLIARCVEIEKRRKDLDNAVRQYLKFSTLRAVWVQYPTPEDVERRCAPTSWEEAVDNVAALQRSIKEKAGVIELFRAKSVDSDRVLREGTPPAAAGDRGIPVFMGGFANQLSQENLRFLLAIRIPCFFIHEYIPLVDFGAPGIKERRQDRECKGFIFADVQAAITANAFDKLALRSNSLYSSTVRYTRISVDPNPNSLSGSWRQLRADRPANLAFRPRPLSPPPDELMDSDDDDDDIPMTSKPLTKIPRGPPPAIIPKSTAPTVHITDVEGRGAELKMNELRVASKRNPPPEDDVKEIWWDREHSYKFYFADSLQSTEPTDPDGFDEWGRPFPTCYVMPRGHKQPKWIYCSAEPKPGYAGMSFGGSPVSASSRNPTTTQRVRDTNLASGAVAGRRDASTSKGKGPSSSGRGSERLGCGASSSGWGTDFSGWGKESSGWGDSSGWGASSSERVAGWGTDSSGWGMESSGLGESSGWGASSSERVASATGVGASKPPIIQRDDVSSGLSSSGTVSSGAGASSSLPHAGAFRSPQSVEASSSGWGASTSGLEASSGMGKSLGHSGSRSSMLTPTMSTDVPSLLRSSTLTPTMSTDAPTTQAATQAATQERREPSSVLSAQQSSSGLSAQTLPPPTTQERREPPYQPAAQQSSSGFSQWSPSLSSVPPPSAELARPSTSSSVAAHNKWTGSQMPFVQQSNEVLSTPPTDIVMGEEGEIYEENVAEADDHRPIPPPPHRWTPSSQQQHHYQHAAYQPSGVFAPPCFPMPNMFLPGGNLQPAIIAPFPPNGFAPAYAIIPLSHEAVADIVPEITGTRREVKTTRRRMARTGNPIDPNPTGPLTPAARRWARKGLHVAGRKRGNGGSANQ
ncbi:hypothetical protein BD410DRAFT_846781 [Rickenella mellea]|uniref:Uncharacterized protein n=1 Tax=Rickenella mellea TaxID=50990 RepID=A0A4Y7PGW8_9AGAM|nr:hypothetical protein BD410DRAFT_846781 [Rickenella mellea]